MAAYTAPYGRLRLPAPAPAPRNLMWQAFEALQQKRHADHAYFRDSIKRQKRLIDSSS